MKTPEEKRWDRMQEILLAEAQGTAQPRVCSQKTLFGIKSHVEEVVDNVAKEDAQRCADRARTRKDCDADVGEKDDLPNS